MLLMKFLPTTYKAYQATDIVLLQNEDPTLPKLHTDWHILKQYFWLLTQSLPFHAVSVYERAWFSVVHCFNFLTWRWLLTWIRRSSLRSSGRTIWLLRPSFIWKKLNTHVYNELSIQYATYLHTAHQFSFLIDKTTYFGGLKPQA